MQPQKKKYSVDSSNSTFVPCPSYARGLELFRTIKPKVKFIPKGICSHYVDHRIRSEIRTQEEIDKVYEKLSTP
jgi:hypothetical protein